MEDNKERRAKEKQSTTKRQPEKCGAKLCGKFRMAVLQGIAMPADGWTEERPLPAGGRQVGQFKDGWIEERPLPAKGRQVGQLNKWQCCKA